MDVKSLYRKKSPVLSCKSFADANNSVNIQIMIFLSMRKWMLFKCNTRKILLPHISSKSYKIFNFN